MIEVEDLVVKYAPELPDVLHGVSFAIKPRERVGLLGRTGSGKSTLAMSILRFVSCPPLTHFNITEPRLYRLILTVGAS